MANFILTYRQGFCSMGGVPEEVTFFVVPSVERVGVVGLGQSKWVNIPTGISGEVGVKVTNFTPQSQIHSHLHK